MKKQNNFVGENRKTCRNQFVGRMAIILLFAMVFSLTIFAGKKVEAKGYKFVSSNPYTGETATIKMGKVQIEKVRNGLKIKKGKSKTILKGVTGSYITNGQNIYYTKDDKPSKLYSYNIKTNKSKSALKVKKKKYIELMGAKGNYLYYFIQYHKYSKSIPTVNKGGVTTFKNGVVSVCAYNLKTKAKKKMKVNVGVPFSLNVKGKKVYIDAFTSKEPFSPVECYEFTLSGKKTKQYTKSY